MLAKPWPTSSMFERCSPPGHRVGDLGRKKAFHAAEEREREGRRQDLQNALETDVRHFRRRQGVRDAAKTAAYGFDAEVKQDSGDRDDRKRDQHARPIGPQAPQAENQRGRAEADSQRCGIERRSRGGERAKLGQQLARLRPVQRKAAEVFKLTGEDGHGDAAGEADRNRVGDVADQRAEPKRSRQGQHDAGKKDRQQQALDTEFRHSGRDQYDERPGRAADLETASAERRYDKAADDRGVETPVGRHARTDRDRHGKRQRHDGDREPSHGVAAKLAKPVALAQDGGEFRPIEMGRRGPVWHPVPPSRRRAAEVEFRLPAQPISPSSKPPKTAQNRTGSRAARSGARSSMAPSRVLARLLPQQRLARIRVAPPPKCCG